MKGRSHRLQSSAQPDDWVDGSWTVDCICGVNYDDGEEMVNCDECGVWVHTRCSRYVKGDDLFACDKCKSKNNQNDSEETEVAQLLVELPTKTMRMETSYVPNGPPRRPFRLWTDMPIEERVHVQGIPGGDPALFGGLTSIFTPDLWKCTGLVPKKFNFQYREFPCWDDDEGDTKIEDENENPVDKGAGVLFSLSKDSVLATPVGTLVGMRGKDEEGGPNRKTYSKETKWEGDDVDVKHAQNVLQNERSHLQRVMLHSGKKKKEELGTSKDRSRKKKTRAAEKDPEVRKKGVHAYKTVVFTPTSDAKQLESNEDRGLRSLETDIERIKNGNLKDALQQAPPSNGYPSVQHTVEKPKNKYAASERSSEDFSSDKSKHNSSTGAEQKEDKVAHYLPARVEISSRSSDVVASLLEHSIAGSVLRTEKGNGMVADNYGVEGPCRTVMKPFVEDVASIPLEVKDSKILENSTDIDLMQPNLKVKTESDDDTSRGVLKLESCPLYDATQRRIPSDHMSENSEVNDVAVGTIQSLGHKSENTDTNFSASACHTNIVDELSRGPSQPKREVEEPKVSQPSIASAGKLSSASSGMVMSKSSVPENLKPVEDRNPSHVTVQRVTSDCNVSITKDCNTDVKDEDRKDMERKRVKDPSKFSDCNISTKKDRVTDVVKDVDRQNTERRTVKEHPKFSVSSAIKAAHSTRTSHGSVSKRATSDTKDSAISSSVKSSSAHNLAVTSAESFSLQNQSNCQPSSKANHTPSTHPPVRPTSLAALSDEELALLLHQELNSSPRVPRVPRVRQGGSLPQLASPTATSMLTKRTSSSGGKDHNLVSRRKGKDLPKEGFRSSSPDQRRQDFGHKADAAIGKREDIISSSEKNLPPASTKMTNSGPSSSAEANDHNLSSIRSSPRNTCEDDTGTVGGHVHRTLPGLINEIMSKGRRMTYEELCNAVLPHWPNLRKHNGERYAYSSHSQAVLDCLRNRHEWAQLVDRGPKTNSGRKRRKPDAEPSSFDSEDIECGNGKSSKEVEVKSFDSREDFPKGKRKARKRRRLALQGRGVKDIRNRRKADPLSDDYDDVGASSNSSEESMFSEDEIQGGGTVASGSDSSDSSDDK